MPNWCRNQLTVVGDRALLSELREASRGVSCPWGGGASELSFASYVMPPDEVVRAGFDKTAYDWCCEHWGTKWPATDVAVQDTEVEDPAATARRHVQVKRVLARLRPLDDGEMGPCGDS
jgi:hypothetical protein